MGYTHYWYREKNILKRTMQAIVTDFGRIVLALNDAGVKLAGPLGKDAPEVLLDCVAFNGQENCGHPKNSEITIPWPTDSAKGIGHNLLAPDGTWFAGTLLATRACNGDCSYESFVFERLFRPDFPQQNERGLNFVFCKTAFRPYDLAVTAFLIVAKHHLKGRLDVSSDGEDQHWEDARQLCQAFLGYGSEYHLEGEAGLRERQSVEAT